MGEQVKVSILVVNYDGGSLLRSCLDSISKQTYRDYEVIVVDNGSRDQSWDLPEFNNRPEYHLIRLNENRGFSEANNCAYDKSEGEYIVLLNNDVVLDSEWLSEMVKAGESAEVGGVACQLRQQFLPDLLDSAGFDLFFNGSTSTAYGVSNDDFDHSANQPFGPVASAALYKKEAIRKTGFLFHNEFFAYYEDTDLAIRLHLYGYKISYAPKAIGWHVGSATGRRKSGFHGYHLRRNIEYLFWINFSKKHIIHYLLPHIIFEAFAFFDMLFRGKGFLFMKAKRDFLSKVRWVLTQRCIITTNVGANPRGLMEKRTLGLKAYLNYKFRNNH